MSAETTLKALIESTENLIEAQRSTSRQIARQSDRLRELADEFAEFKGALVAATSRNGVPAPVKNESSDPSGVQVLPDGTIRAQLSKRWQVILKVLWHVGYGAVTALAGWAWHRWGK